ncbi:hypothetical protein BKA62DRAFT_834410 [Auriculariales sp. MPI-PUGE-AT-0066]|nr:hypothetical protein BKA62DRAFT_834410 [Auriculariales sp. MPI-PUGE-AT-0066]
MALDQNLFTLNIITSEKEPDAIDLVEPSGIIHYRKRRVRDPTGNAPYCWSLFEPLSDGLLSTVTAPSAASKLKTLSLHNPDATIELKYTGTLSFKWCFDWEEHTFEWRREACYMLRKPDPPVQVAVTREPSGRIKTSVVQILDYNLSRFDIHDRKGLEILMLTALLTFTDSADEYASSRGAAQPAAQTSPTAPPGYTPRYTDDGAPPPPPIPEKSALDRIVMAQAQENMGPNEVLIAGDVNVNDYARYGCDLLKDDNILYIVLKSGGPDEVPKVMAVAEGVKRLRHKAGVEENLHFYPTYNEAPVKGPKVIKLDDSPSAAPYQPPMNLIIHLSKIPMPELQPKPKQSSRHQRKGSSPPRHMKPPEQDRKPRRRNSQEAQFMQDPWAGESSKRRDGYASDYAPTNPNAAKAPKPDREKGKGKDKDKDKKRPSPSPGAGPMPVHPHAPPPPPGQHRQRPSPPRGPPPPQIPLSPQPGRAGKLSKQNTPTTPLGGSSFPMPNYVPGGQNQYNTPIPRPQQNLRPQNEERPTSIFGRIAKW